MKEYVYVSLLLEMFAAKVLIRCIIRSWAWHCKQMKVNVLFAID